MGLEGSCFIANLNQIFLFYVETTLIMWRRGMQMLSNYADLDSPHPVRSSGTEKLNIKQSRLLCGDKYNANCMLTQSKYVFLIQSALFDLRHSISFMAKINSLLKEILTEYYKFTHLMKGHTCIVAFCNHLSSSKQTS